MITLVIASFIAFVVWVESYRFRIYLRESLNELNNTFGRADWVYPNTKEQQPWMKK